MDAGMKKRGLVFSRLRQQRGAAMVEFAIVAPLLFVLLFGIIEFGVMLYDQAVITNASREGARFAATYYADPVNDSIGTGTPRTCSEVKNFVQSYVNARIISLTSSPPPLEGCCGGTLTDNHTVLPCKPSASWPVTGTKTGLDTPESPGLLQGVTVSYSYNFLVFGSLIQLIDGSVSPTWDLTATSVMRDENQTPGS